MKKGGKKSKGEDELDKKFAMYAKAMYGKDVNTLAEESRKAKGTKGKMTGQQKVNLAQRKGVAVDVVTKNKSNKKSEVSNVGKLLNEDIEIKEVPKEIAVQVQQARNEKKLTQDQLAKKISESINVIKDLESCTGVYNPKVVEKIERALNVKFDRSWKK